jgi:hypothetical protein
MVSLDLAEILSHADILKRAIEATEIKGLETWKEFGRWQQFAEQAGHPLTIQWARAYACSDLRQVLLPMESSPFLDSIALPPPVADAVCGLWSAVRGSSVFLHVHRYKHDVLTAIESLRMATADTSADTRKKKREAFPRTKEPVLLARRINDPANHGRTQIAIALDFTEGNERKAENLLRTIRRTDLLKRTKPL